jgi:23S rRNA G2445 N2-methylase RlmL
VKSKSERQPGPLSKKSKQPGRQPDKQPRILKLSERIEAQTEASFFAIANPGMEKLVRREIEEILHGRELIETVGGVQFQAQVQSVYLGQPKLKTVNRLLLRVDQFGVRDFQKLFRKVKGLPWKSWLKPGVGLKARASSHASRLKIKKGIERTILDAFSEVVKAKPQKELLVLARVEDDICTLSLDLSGELLHKRGDREEVGLAPLRETWAAGILTRAWEILAEDQALREKFSQPWHWIEPMAGTAVFAREALKAQTPVTSRTFAMEDCLNVEGLKVEMAKPKVMESEDTAKHSDAGIWSPLKNLKRLSVFDHDSSQLKKAQAGVEEVLAATVTACRVDPNLETEFMASDLKHSRLNLADGQARFVILNPPWGIRLKSEDAVSSFERQARLLQEIQTQLQPAFVAVVFPKIQAAPGPGGGAKALKTPSGWTEHEGFSFRAGGIPVDARFFSVGSVRTR